MCVYGFYAASCSFTCVSNFLYSIFSILIASYRLCLRIQRIVLL